MTAEDAEVELYYDDPYFQGRESFRQSAARHKAPLPDGSEIPPTGKRIESPFCKMSSLHSYTDSLTAMARLGLIPAPEATEA